MALATIERDDGWVGVAGKPRRWKATDEGILVRGDKGVRRTRWAKKTTFMVRGEDGAQRPKKITYLELAAHTLAEYEVEINNAAEVTGVDVRVIAAMVTGESGGDPSLRREEPAHSDWSFGVAQTLTGTAYQIARSQGFPRETLESASSYRLPSRSIPAGGDFEEWRVFLTNTRNSILIGAGVLQYANDRFKLEGDPVLMYACYNAGSPVPSNNDWGLVNYGSALSAFVNFYGDVCAALKAEAAARESNSV